MHVMKSVGHAEQDGACLAFHFFFVFRQNLMYLSLNLSRSVS